MRRGMPLAIGAAAFSVRPWMHIVWFYILLGMLVVASCNRTDFSSHSGKAPRREVESPGGGSVGADPIPVNPTPIPVNPPQIPDRSAPVQSTSIKLGINFEDRGLRGDRDYNDDVLCFEGKFEVVKASGLITSLADQQVVGLIHRNADCRQRITVTIRHPDGTQNQIVREPLQKVLITEMLNFRAGSTLDVVFQALDKKCDLETHRVTEPDFVLFGFDVCRSPAASGSSQR